MVSILLVIYKSKRELDNLCGRDETAHQGLIAEVEQLEEVTLKEFVMSNKKENLNFKQNQNFLKIILFFLMNY